MNKLRASLLGLSLAALAACDDLSSGLGGNAPVEPPPPSPESEALRSYYAELQRDFLARGLLRTDGGGPDTPYTPDMLARNFEQIAFFNEYEIGESLDKAQNSESTLRRWSKPVRINVEFGPSVPRDTRSGDVESITSLASRLAKATEHDISVTARNRANFHVLVTSFDDREFLQARVDQLLPGTSPATRKLFANLGRDYYCVVIANTDISDSNTYVNAVALVRAEHPDLLRKSCYHEEIAQGLGLANDSPNARPSIFNDDEEFALLTTHDEALLSMLYDPRLSVGMSLDEARPVIYQLAREKAGRLF